MSKTQKVAELIETFGSRNPDPLDKEDYVGVEIECIIPGGPDKIRAKLAEMLVDLKLEDKVRIGEDGSIRYNKPPYYGAEIKVLDTNKKISQTITKVSTVLRKMGAVVNTSCGLHVHLDMRYKNEKTREKVFNNLYMSQNLLFSLVRKDRQKNKFCKKMGKKIKVKEPPAFYYNEKGQMVYGSKTYTINPVFNEVKNINDRRYAINLRSLIRHKTIEIRLHHGTINALMINKWIGILQRIATSDEFKKPLATKKKGLKELGL
jgi:hypothetical protein